MQVLGAQIVTKYNLSSVQIAYIHYVYILVVYFLKAGHTLIKISSLPSISCLASLISQIILSTVYDFLAYTSSLKPSQKVKCPFGWGILNLPTHH